MSEVALKEPGSGFVNPPVSIYIITYLNTRERCRILRSCCKNVLAQRYSDFEVVVSDNGGKYFAEVELADILDDRLRIVRNEDNLGFTGNINKCVDSCRHEIIKPMCDDDLLHPDCLSRTVSHVGEGTVVVVDHQKFNLNTEPECLNKSLSCTAPHTKRPAGYGLDLWHLPFSACPSTTLFTKSLFRTLNGYDELSLVSDWDFLVRACVGHEVCHVKLPLCYMGVWDESLTEQINVDQPFYFPAAGLYTKSNIFKSGGIGFLNQMLLVLELLLEVVVQFFRLLRHFNQKIYRSGFVKYLSEWITCATDGRRGRWNHADPAFQDG